MMHSPVRYAESNTMPNKRRGTLSNKSTLKAEQAQIKQLQAQVKQLKLSKPKATHSRTLAEYSDQTSDGCLAVLPLVLG